MRVAGYIFIHTYSCDPLYMLLLVTCLFCYTYHLKNKPTLLQLNIHSKNSFHLIYNLSILQSEGQAKVVLYVSIKSLLHLPETSEEYTPMTMRTRSGRGWDEDDRIIPPSPGDWSPLIATPRHPDIVTTRTSAASLLRTKCHGGGAAHFL